MDSDYLNSNNQEEKGRQNVSVCDHANGQQNSSTKSDSFVLDFSHLTEKDIISANSRITRNLSRKGSVRSGGGGVVEKKLKPTTANEGGAAVLAASTTGTLHGGGGTPEKPAVVAGGTPADPITPQVHHHHQITIKNCSMSTAAGESKRGGKRFSGFRHSPPAWFLDPRRILVFFATLSSMGTILLIYFTLSMGKLNGDDDGVN